MVSNAFRKLQLLNDNRLLLYKLNTSTDGNFQSLVKIVVKL